MHQNIFFYELAIFWSAKKRRKDTFFSTLHPLSTVIFATATVLAFVQLRYSRFNFHCYTQREATPTQKSARKCAATSCAKITKRIHSSKPASLNHPIELATHSTSALPLHYIVRREAGTACTAELATHSTSALPIHYIVRREAGTACTVELATHSTSALHLHYIVRREAGTACSVELATHSTSAPLAGTPGWHPTAE